MGGHHWLGSWEAAPTTLALNLSALHIKASITYDLGKTLVAISLTCLEPVFLKHQLGSKLQGCYVAKGDTLSKLTGAL